MADATTVNTYIDVAVAAIAAGDNATALQNLRAARVALIAIPDGTQGPDSVKWGREDIDAAIKDLQKTSGASLGVHRSKVRYRHDETADGCYA